VNLLKVVFDLTKKWEKVEVTEISGSISAAL
jgi:hypothetical protein